jgi:uncharacterized membrane protein
MVRRRGLMFIVMAVCWIVLLAFVVTSVFQTTKKQHQGKVPAKHSDVVKAF